MLSSVEIIALVVTLLVIVKIIFLVFSPRTWLSMVSKIYSRPKLISLIALIIAAFVLNFLLKEVSITQVFAVTAFISLIIISGIAFFARDIIKLKESIISRNYAKKYWWYILIWLLLAVWVLEEILT